MQTRTPEVLLAEKMQDFTSALNIIIDDIGNKKVAISFPDIKDAVNAVTQSNSGAKKSKTQKAKLKTITEGIQKISLESKAEEIRPLYKEAAALIPPGLEVTAVGNNNLNFIVRDPNKDTKIVIQLSKKLDMKLNSMHVDEILKNHSAAMAADYGKPFFTPIIEGDPLPKKVYNSYNNENMMSIRYMEYCPKSIEKAVNEAKTEEEKLALALRITTQTSALLTQLSENNIIWTDLKNGNILLRENGNIVITDTKGFLFKDAAYVFYNEKSNQFIVSSPITTKGLCSKAELDIGVVAGSARLAIPKELSVPQKKEKLKENMPAITEEAKTARNITMQQWQKEYNYQMAVLIYFTLTGEDKFRENEFNFNTSKFNFNTTAGIEMKKIIERLSHDDPNNRMTHQDAVKAFKQSAELKKVLVQDTLDRAASRSGNLNKSKVEKNPEHQAIRQHDLKIIRDPTHVQHYNKKSENLAEPTPPKPSRKP